MRDYIISTNPDVFAFIDYEKVDGIDYYYRGTFIEFNFPDELIFLINEYNEIIDSMAISLLDEVENKIVAYGLKLKNAGVKIFNISINDNEILFFTKYPSSRGFLDNYPGVI